MIRQLFLSIITFSLLAVILMGWFAPNVIVWYFAPPGNMPFNCKDSVEWGIYAFRKILLISAAGGGVVGTLFYLFLINLRKTMKKPSQPPESPHDSKKPQQEIEKT